MRRTLKTFTVMAMVAALAFSAMAASGAGGSVDKATGDILVSVPDPLSPDEGTAHVVFNAHEEDPDNANRPAKGEMTQTRYRADGSYWDSWEFDVKCVNIVDETTGYFAAEVISTDHTLYEPATQGGVLVVEVQDHGSSGAMDVVSWAWETNTTATTEQRIMSACESVAAGTIRDTPDRSEVEGNLVIHLGQGHSS